MVGLDSSDPFWSGSVGKEGNSLPKWTLEEQANSALNVKKSGVTTFQFAGTNANAATPTIVI